MLLYTQPQALQYGAIMLGMARDQDRFTPSLGDRLERQLWGFHDGVEGGLRGMILAVGILARSIG